MVLTEEDKNNLRKVIYDAPTAQRVIDLLVLAGQDSFSPGNGQFSQVQTDQSGSNTALGVGSTVMGTGNEANGAASVATGMNSRTGNPFRVFTCSTGGTTLTYANIDVTAEYYVATGLIPNIIIGYTDTDNQPRFVGRLVSSVTLVGSDTVIVIDSIIDSITVTGKSVDPYFGSYAVAQGLNCIAQGTGSRALGQFATAIAAGSIAEGTQVTAVKRLSRAQGYGSIANDFNEHAYGNGFTNQIGDNQDRTLRVFGYCTNTATLDLTLDGTSVAVPGVEAMSFPDDSCGTCLLRMTAAQVDSSAANYGDAWTAVYAFGLKRIAGVLSFVGIGMATVLDEQDGAVGWTINVDTAGTAPIIQFKGQAGVRVRCTLEISQIAKL